MKPIHLSPIQYLTPFSSALKPQSRTTHIVAFWLAILFYTCTIWFARLSIMSSLIRIVPPSRSIRLATLGSSCILALMWFYTLLAKTLACAIDTSWYHAGAPQCPIPEWVAISEVIGESSCCRSALVYHVFRISSGLTVRYHACLRPVALTLASAPPLESADHDHGRVFCQYLDHCRQHRSYRIRHSAEFHRRNDSADRGRCIYHFSGVLHSRIRLPQSMVSLVVCNLLVLVTFIYRTTHDGRDLTASMKATGTSHRLTSIELYISGATESCHVSTNTEMRDTDTEGASATLASTGITTSGANAGIGRSHCGGHSGPSLLASDVKSYSTELGTDSG